MGFLYRITGPTGAYIGITERPVHKRWNEHINAAGRQKRNSCRRLGAAIRKHGKESFQFDVLVEAEWADLLWMEKLAIECYNTLSPYGYNLSTGGEQSRHSDETRQAISAATKARWNDADERQKLRHTQSAETRAKIALTMTGRKRTPEDIEAMRKAALANRENRVRAGRAGGAATKLLKEKP